MRKPLTELPAYDRLRAHRGELEGVHMRTLFASDPERFEHFSCALDDLLFDYSKNRLVGHTIELLVELAEQAHLSAAIDAMFAGKHLNLTEGRAVLHVALRNRSEQPAYVDGRDVMPDVRRVLGQMRALTDAIGAGTWLGATGERITDVVNLGIGGSHLGPEMAVRALRPYAREVPRVHFVSNVDGADLVETLRPLRPQQTLFLVASKTFTTLETLTNARSARRWLLDGLALSGQGGAEAVSRHFVAITANVDEAVRFGVAAEHALELWDWVGGRYSLWSAVGTSIACAVGMDAFEELLTGAHDIDEHFRTAPLGQNIPVLMGLIGLWYHTFWGAESYAVLPYDQSLERLPAHLQQLDMESNGKRVRRGGEPLDGPLGAYGTGPIVWGAPGTNGQHAFFQLLHQGTRLIPCDFLAPAESERPLGDHHEKLLASCLAQTEALMRGRTREEVDAALTAEGLSRERVEALAPHRVFPGDRPTNTLLFRRLTPRTLGRLVALYEHKVFVQGVLWDINSFDQWGVELGKALTSDLLPELRAERGPGAHDGSTLGQLAYLAAAAASRPRPR